MKKYNKLDLYRYEGERCNNLLVQLRYLLFTPGFQYSYCFRHAQNASFLLTRVFWMVLLRFMMYHTTIQIPYQTSIGPGLKFGHWGNIVVNPFAKIGKNLSISNGCCIGNSAGKKAGVPVIGDNVVLNANSVICGGVRVGNNVLVAPGAFINFDVPDNSIVIGNPGQIIRRDSSPTQKYIVYQI